MKVYKVIRSEAHNGRVRYTSALARGKAEVCYKVGRYVEAPAWLAQQGYHLFVFGSLKDGIDTLEEAKAYYEILKAEHYNQGILELWEAEAQDVLESRDIPDMYLDELKNGVLVPSGISLGARGVLLAKRVKLEKRIYPIDKGR